MNQVNKNEEIALESVDAFVATSTPSLRRPRLKKCSDIAKPNQYVHMLDNEFRDHAFNEDRAVALKGKWREALGVESEHPMDLEIGTGNGFHFANLAKRIPERSLLGIELKFKPLVQSIRRALNQGAQNAFIARYDASRLQDMFEPGELNNVYIHFPDPWPKSRQWKHRLIQEEFLNELFLLMRPGSFVDFKTDSLDYYEWALERFLSSQFTVVRQTRDLHNSDWKDENFVTHFESIFLQQGTKINYARLLRV